MNQFDNEHTRMVLLESENKRLSTEGGIMREFIQQVADGKPPDDYVQKYAQDVLAAVSGKQT